MKVTWDWNLFRRRRFCLAAARSGLHVNFQRRKPFFHFFFFFFWRWRGWRGAGRGTVVIRDYVASRRGLERARCIGNVYVAPPATTEGGTVKVTELPTGQPPNTTVPSAPKVLVCGVLQAPYLSVTDTPLGPDEVDPDGDRRRASAAARGFGADEFGLLRHRFFMHDGCRFGIRFGDADREVAR